MRSLLLLLILIPVFVTNTYAQDNLANYKRAKTLIGYGNYKEAMGLLVPYMDDTKFGELSKYATYHFAHAGYLNNQFELASTSLKPLLEVKSWRKLDDAKYLYALANFQKKDNLSALVAISEIKDANLFKEAEKASYIFLKNESVSFLTSNLSKFNANQGFMQALKEKLESQTIMSTDEKAIYNQVKSAKIEDGIAKKEKNKNPQFLDVAVILPFNYSGGSGVNNLNAHNFIFELYQGLKLGVDELNKNGKKVNLRSFDSARNPEKLKQILADPFLEIADIIVGPVYPEETEIVAAFAENNDIPFINPLSNVDEKFEAYDFAYLFRPSVSSISQGLMDFSRKNLEGKRIAIAYSGATRDELLSKQTAELAVKLGYQIVANKSVNEKDIRTFFSNLNVSRNSNPKADMVFVFSDDPNIASPIFGLLESINVDLPIFVMDSWLYFNFANYEMLENQNLRFIGNNAVRLESPEVENFKNGFYKQFNTFPSFNAHLGYDLAYWLHESINVNEGFDLRKNLDKKGFRKGKISYGTNFQNSKNNRYIPIFKLEDGVLIEK
ncbi:ABC transporter substrate-binding protein [Rhodonellum sp.]|uniref:ABC transporter substrate-binding protein n=1 Tax=Rhodonellum sp. TaxID=2231180 RepID=UPI002723D162|nr:ABC transporter substrate-binding protein [Rhodonellum sp.]MDO9551844.1 ABC transporter substrate-binding protein [Rhodonellum sp.]